MENTFQEQNYSRLQLEGVRHGINRAVADAAIVTRFPKHHKRYKNIVKPSETLIKHHEILIKHFKTLLKHRITLLKQHETHVKHTEILIKHP